MIQIAKGMESLALASVIHRDVKPTNILELNGQWCLADFGIARITSKATATHTFQGSGTLEYRAPEIWRGQHETVEADYYALGCIAFELITGQKAFPCGDDIRERHLGLVLELPDNCDPTLRSVVAQLLAKDPMARPRDARQVREQLEACGTFSPQQQLFQGIRAKLDERVLRVTASRAAAAERDERYRMAGVQVNTLWKRFSQKIKQVFPDTEDESGPGLLALRFRGISVSIEDETGGGYFDPGERPEFVLAAEVRVRPASGHLVYLANIYSVWGNGMPTTNLIRFETLDTKDPMKAPDVRELLPRGIKPGTMPRAYSEHGNTFGQKSYRRRTRGP